MSWIRRLAGKPTDGDPITISFENGRLYAGRYSEPAALASNRKPSRDRKEAVLKEAIAGPATEYETPEALEPQIQRAADILAPLLISIQNIRDIVNRAIPRKRLWQRGEKKAIASVAKAWAVLAPLGVEPSDFRHLIDEAGRKAWTTQTNILQRRALTDRGSK